MITLIKWSEPKNELGKTREPVEYIGIAVPAAYVTGRITLAFGLNDNLSALVIGISPDQSALKDALFGQALRKFKGESDFHIVECYESVSAIFGTSQGQSPTEEQLKKYLQNIIENYDSTSEGSYQAVSVSAQGHFAQPQARPQPVQVPENEINSSYKMS